MTKILKYTREIIICILLILIILLLKRCGDAKDKANATAEANKALIEKNRQDSIRNERAYLVLKARTDSLGIVTAAAETEKQKADEKLSATEQQLRQTIAQLDQARNQTPTGNWKYVSPDYVMNCDQLEQQTKTLFTQLTTARTKYDDLTNLMKYEIGIRDTSIADCRKSLAKARANFHASTALTDQAQAHSRGRLLGGAGVLGNQYTILYGASVKIAYQNRAGKQYQVALHIMPPGLFYEVGVLVPLIK